MQDPPRRKILPDAPSKSTHYTQGEHMIMNTNRYNFRIRVLLKITTGGLMYKLPQSNHHPQRLDKRIEETSGLHTRR